MDPVLLQAAEDSENWPEALIALAGIAMITVIVAVAIWQVFASWRARMSVAREEAYRRLAKESVTAQKATGDGLVRAVGKLEELEQRTAAIERLLKEVE